MLTTRVVIEVTHLKEIPELANMIAGRAWSIGGVTKAEVVSNGNAVADLEAQGFTLQEIALGAEGEVHRS